MNREGKVTVKSQGGPGTFTYLYRWGDRGMNRPAEGPAGGR